MRKFTQKDGIFNAKSKNNAIHPSILLSKMKQTSISIVRM